MQRPLPEGLSQEEQAQVLKICSADTRHKFHKDFKKKNIAKNLFKADVDTDQAELIWYSILARIETDREAESSKAKMFLNKEEEVLLFKQMNYAKWRVNRIKERVEKRRLSLKECRGLLLWYQIYKKIENKICVTNLGLVSLIMRSKGYGYRKDANEMRSALSVGLFAGIRGFDISMGFKFSTYACRAIIQHGNRYIEMRVKGDRIYDKSVIDEYAHPSTKVDFDANLRAEELREALDNNYAGLTEEETEIIKMRFGIDQVRGAYTLLQIGDIQGVSKERVRQRQKSAMKKLVEYYQLV